MLDIYFLGCWIVFGMILKTMLEIQTFKDYFMLAVVVFFSWISFGYLLNEYLGKKGELTIMNKCYDCKNEHEMLWSTPNFTKHSYSAAVCKECFKVRRGKYPDKIKKGE